MLNTGFISALLTVLVGLGAIAFPRLGEHKDQLDALVPHLAIVALGLIGLADEIAASIKARHAAHKKSQHRR